MSTPTAPVTKSAKDLRHRQYVPAPPDAATTALPGTENKVKVLEERAALGLELWHPEDQGWANAAADTTSRHRPGRFARAIENEEAEIAKAASSPSEALQRSLKDAVTEALVFKLTDRTVPFARFESDDEIV